MKRYNFYNRSQPGLYRKSVDIIRDLKPGYSVYLKYYPDEREDDIDMVELVCNVDHVLVVIKRRLQNGRPIVVSTTDYGNAERVLEDYQLD